MAPAQEALEQLPPGWESKPSTSQPGVIKFWKTESKNETVTYVSPVGDPPLGRPVPEVPDGWNVRYSSNESRFFYWQNGGESQWETPNIGNEPQNNSTIDSVQADIEEDPDFLAILDSFPKSFMHNDQANQLSRQSQDPIDEVDEIVDNLKTGHDLYELYKSGAVRSLSGTKRDYDGDVMLETLQHDVNKFTQGVYGDMSDLAHWEKFRSTKYGTQFDDEPVAGFVLLYSYVYFVNKRNGWRMQVDGSLKRYGTLSPLTYFQKGVTNLWRAAYKKWGSRWSEYSESAKGLPQLENKSALYQKIDHKFKQTWVSRNNEISKPEPIFKQDFERMALGLPWTSSGHRTCSLMGCLYLTGARAESFVNLAPTDQEYKGTDQDGYPIYEINYDPAKRQDTRAGPGSVTLTGILAYRFHLFMKNRTLTEWTNSDRLFCFKDVPEIDNVIDDAAVLVGYPTKFFSSSGFRHGFVNEAIIRATMKGRTDLNTVLASAGAKLQHVPNSQSLESYIRPISKKAETFLAQGVTAFDQVSIGQLHPSLIAWCDINGDLQESVYRPQRPGSQAGTTVQYQTAVDDIFDAISLDDRNNIVYDTDRSLDEKVAFIAGYVVTVYKDKDVPICLLLEAYVKSSNKKREAELSTATKNLIRDGRITEESILHLEDVQVTRAHRHHAELQIVPVNHQCYKKTRGIFKMTKSLDLRTVKQGMLNRRNLNYSKSKHPVVVVQHVVIPLLMLNDDQCQMLDRAKLRGQASVSVAQLFGFPTRQGHDIAGHFLKLQLQKVEAGHGVIESFPDIHFEVKRIALDATIPVPTLNDLKSEKEKLDAMNFDEISDLNNDDFHKATNDVFDLTEKLVLSERKRLNEDIFAVSKEEHDAYMQYRCTRTGRKLFTPSQLNLFRSLRPLERRERERRKIEFIQSLQKRQDARRGKKQRISSSKKRKWFEMAADDKEFDFISSFDSLKLGYGSGTSGAVTGIPGVGRSKRRRLNVRNDPASTLPQTFADILGPFHLSRDAWPRDYPIRDGNNQRCRERYLNSTLRFHSFDADSYRKSTKSRETKKQTNPKRKGSTTQKGRRASLEKEYPLGTVVCKKFDDRWYQGFVVAIVSIPDHPGQKFYRVAFQDHDVHDFTMDEMNKQTSSRNVGYFRSSQAKHHNKWDQRGIANTNELSSSNVPDLLSKRFVVDLDIPSFEPTASYHLLVAASTELEKKGFCVEMTLVDGDGEYCKCYVSDILRDIAMNVGEGFIIKITQCKRKHFKGDTKPGAVVQKFDIVGKLPLKLKNGTGYVTHRQQQCLGLVNLGNTCYMNATIQCLAHTTYLRQYFLFGEYKPHLNRENNDGTGGNLTETFADLLKEMWGMENKDIAGAVSPKKFKTTLDIHASCFVGRDQHDSQEFAAALLDMLHEDTNRIVEKPTVEILGKMDGETDADAAKRAWELYLLRDDSCIVETFTGQGKKHLKCPDCGNASTKYDPFVFLSVPIPEAQEESHAIDVTDCISTYCEKEQLEETEAWKCNRCKAHVRAWRKEKIYKAPKILIVHLKRFRYFKDTHEKEKIDAFIDFPLKDLDLKEYVIGWNDGEEPIYDLYAVSNHMGVLGGGHCTAFVLNDDGKWYEYNDHRVPTELTEEAIVSNNAYCLFYRRRDFCSDTDELEPAKAPQPSSSSSVSSFLAPSSPQESSLDSPEIQPLSSDSSFERPRLFDSSDTSCSSVSTPSEESTSATVSSKFAPSPISTHTRVTSQQSATPQNFEDMNALLEEVDLEPAGPLTQRGLRQSYEELRPLVHEKIVDFEEARQIINRLRLRYAFSNSEALQVSSMPNESEVYKRLKEHLQVAESVVEEEERRKAAAVAAEEEEDTSLYASI